MQQKVAAKEIVVSRHPKEIVVSRHHHSKLVIIMPLVLYIRCLVAKKLTF